MGNQSDGAGDVSVSGLGDLKELKDRVSHKQPLHYYIVSLNHLLTLDHLLTNRYCRLNSLPNTLILFKYIFFHALDSVSEFIMN